MDDTLSEWASHYHFCAHYVIITSRAVQIQGSQKVSRGCLNPMQRATRIASFLTEAAHKSDAVDLSGTAQITTLPQHDRTSLIHPSMPPVFTTSAPDKRSRLMADTKPVISFHRWHPSGSSHTINHDQGRPLINQLLITTVTIHAFWPRQVADRADHDREVHNMPLSTVVVHGRRLIPTIDHDADPTPAVRAIPSIMSRDLCHHRSRSAIDPTANHVGAVS
jgi:hypothetical protein